MKYIVALSGGKDSTAMCDLLLKNNYPVDYILFNDTLSEYPEMYEYIEKLNEYFTLRYGIGITRTTPIRGFKDSVLRTVTRSKTESRNGQCVGLPVASGEAMCHLRKTLKMNPSEKWIRENIIGEYKVYIGYTTEEASRAVKSEVNLYPLITEFKYSEYDCKMYLENQEMENPLYRHFIRTGCAMCPYKSERDWFNTWKYHNDIFEEAKIIEEELKKQDEYNLFFGNKMLKEHEKKFARNNASLFDFSDEPLKDCFCKI